MLLRADEDNDDVIESYSLYYIFSVFPSFVYYYMEVSHKFTPKKIQKVSKFNKGWSHKAPFSRLYLVKL